MPMLLFSLLIVRGFQPRKLGRERLEFASDLNNSMLTLEEPGKTRLCLRFRSGDPAS